MYIDEDTDLHKYRVNPTQIRIDIYIDKDIYVYVYIAISTVRSFGWTLQAQVRNESVFNLNQHKCILIFI